MIDALSHHSKYGNQVRDAKMLSTATALLHVRDGSRSRDQTSTSGIANSQLTIRTEV